ncbi:hypothetical protein D3C78_1684090 [compost metagenome]
MIHQIGIGTLCHGQIFCLAVDPVSAGKGPKNTGIKHKAFLRVRCNVQLIVDFTNKTAIDFVLRLFHPKTKNITLQLILKLCQP